MRDRKMRPDIYSETQARAVSVNSQAILHALEKIYDAPDLAAKLRGK
jgi:hypothetical protein